MPSSLGFGVGGQSHSTFLASTETQALTCEFPTPQGSPRRALWPLFHLASRECLF